MDVNELWNILSGLGPHEKVVVDATGLRIGRHGHVDVPVAPDCVVYVTVPEESIEAW